MSVESEILRIQHNIANAYAKVAEKGGEVPLQPVSVNLAAAVESIPQTLPPPDNNPIGTIISFMGTSAPKDYLVCDGAECSISQYPALASFFAEQFGAKNHFGGDGTATFAVPDMRNLFLRGYHGEAEEHLSGEIGQKQEATETPYMFSSATSQNFVAAQNTDDVPINMDTSSNPIQGVWYFDKYTTNIAIKPSRYTSRPVNMAVLYCIKAIQSGPALEEYDTDDGWHIQKWSDGYVEMVYVRDYVSVAWSATTGGYYLNKIGGVTLPVSLVKKYTDDARLLNIGAAGIYSVVRESAEGANSTLGIHLSCAVDPGAGKNFTLSVSVTGRWK